MVSMIMSEAAVFTSKKCSTIFGSETVDVPLSTESRDPPLPHPT